MWLITLSGSNFAQALAQTAAAPYIDSQLVPAGTLLSGWSSLDASSFASEAGLLGGEPPQTLDSIVQPPCPEGAAGTACAPETAGALTAADEFLKATLPAITASAAYREHGLVVITFGSVGNATASEPARRRLDRDAQLRAARGRAAALAVRPRRRAADERPSTRLHPSRAFPGFCTDAVSADPYIRSSRNQPRRPTLHALDPAHRKQATWWLVALVGFTLALLLAVPAISHAEESNPNNYTCLGSIAAGDARSGQRRTAGGVRLLLQRPDHRLPAAGADPADGRPEPRRS